MKRVLVLMGGPSAERQVSLVSGRAVLDALHGDPLYTAEGFDLTAANAGALVARLTADPRIDLIFNALHGQVGEDGRVQGLFDLLRVPYTHSGVRASANAMHKPTAKLLVAQAGVPTVPGVLIEAGALDRGQDPMPRPYVAKPADEGSSVGVRIVRAGANHPARAPDEPAKRLLLVEPFVPGRELTVAVLDHGDGAPTALAVTEIASSAAFYDYEAKYAAGGSRHLLPAALPAEVSAAALAHAVVAHRALGCRGVTRSDFRYDSTPGGYGLIYLETNTQPGLTPTSLVPEQAAFRGTPFRDLIHLMLEAARCD